MGVLFSRPVSSSVLTAASSFPLSQLKGGKINKSRWLDWLTMNGTDKLATQARHPRTGGDPESWTPVCAEATKEGAGRAVATLKISIKSNKYKIINKINDI